MHTSGYIRSWRKSVKSAVWQDSVLWHVWSWCLFKAAWKPMTCAMKAGRSVIQVDLKVGQFVTGRQAASREICVPQTSLWRKLKKLETLGNVEVKAEVNYTLVTVCNYSLYANAEDHHGCQTETGVEQEWNRSGGQSSQTTTTTVQKTEAKADPKVVQANTNRHTTYGKHTDDSGGQSGTGVEQEWNRSGAIEEEEEVKKKKKESSLSKKLRFSVEDTATAFWIFSKLRELDPGHKKPKLEKWANTIRLMRERDNRTDAEIRSLFEWANKDDFWKANILSPDKLRQKWGHLTIKRNSDNGKPRQSDSPARRHDRDYSHLG